jgi:hypothetical protein
MSSNDWGARIAREAREAIAREATGMGAIALYVRDHVMPYIGMRVQEGAARWRPDSDEAVADVIRDILESAGVDSVKGIDKASPEYVATRNAQGFIRRAVAFYRAVSLLTAKHDVAPDWQAGRAAPLFPLAWFVPDGSEMLHAKGVATHARITGKAKVSVLTLKDGTVEPISVTVSEASILAASRPKAERAANTGEKASDAPAPSTLPATLEQTASMLAKADNMIAGEASDAFVALLEAFMDASPANLALIAGLVEMRVSKRSVESVAA